MKLPHIHVLIHIQWTLGCGGLENSRAHSPCCPPLSGTLSTLASSFQLPWPLWTLSSVHATQGSARPHVDPPPGTMAGNSWQQLKQSQKSLHWFPSSQGPPSFPARCPVFGKWFFSRIFSGFIASGERPSLVPSAPYQSEANNNPAFNTECLKRFASGEN